MVRRYVTGYEHGDGKPDYVERLRIEAMGTKCRIWHTSSGIDRGEVALIAEVEDQDGFKWQVTLSRSCTVPPALLAHATRCDTARWIADWYNKEAERVAQQCLRILQSSPPMRYPETSCRRAVDHAGLPEAVNWPTDPESLPDKIRRWAHLHGPVAEPTRPHMPARDVTVRQPGKPLAQFLAIDCQQAS